jgi:Cu/Ag efflux protein CusF
MRRTILAALALACTPLLVHAQAMTDAEVRKVDAARGKITLKHGEIKNLDMPAMSMVFSVKDPGMLSRVQPGDKVRFTADKIKGVYTVTSLEVRK